MRSPRILVAFALMSVSACAGRQQTGLVGQGTAFVQPRSQDASPDTTGAHPPWDTTIDDSIELARGDLGGGRLTSTVRVMTGGAGVCAVTATADDAMVLGTYQVTRIRDPHLEQRAREATQRAAAIQVSGRVATPVVMQESALVEHHLAVARAQAEARVQLETEDRARAQSIYDAQVRAQQDAEVVAQTRVVVDLEQRRLDLAQRTRDDLRRRWVAWGAIPRPPMPALLAEEAGEPPFPGARWTPGTWHWVNGRWTWRAGYWSSPDFDDTGGDLMVSIETGLDFDLGDGGGGRSRPRIVDHRTGPRIRDHRRNDDDRGSTIRDHRDRDSSSNKPEPTVRDHRNNAREELPKSTIRDHRDDKDDKKDDDERTGTVRDHRRR